MVPRTFGIIFCGLSVCFPAHSLQLHAKMVAITWRSDKHEIHGEMAPTVKRHLLTSQSVLQLTSQNEQCSTNGWCKSPFAYALQQNYGTLVQLKGTRTDYVEKRAQEQRQDCRQSSEKLNLNCSEHVLFLKRGHTHIPPPVKFVCFLITQLHRSFSL